ncbi:MULTISPECIES: DUF1788 domain-containing protein [Lacticaseibacillus]|uniref:DUF1788 domain-containing protein n=1 Tax=Lacticaseibacillus casei DSM 20011 = JCM 1134 = ATCC 393 TaxID=1423732 RepID=A0AAD1ET78_LACCA|nr:DUF1788 domain-containing protein [Lacticaseibacillus casei]MBI6596854.1 DUF1788 domain-containing protein [Lacticaseibacillus casei]MBO1480631.1 DUF1788 domain-containing protein [Lacticaseibacillus casei]MBO2415910.1 DUF1788 domain-containing protein [Lacticaseibacillus casei]MCK2081036.1 DUF1788 domain-containing protein [Lacticaseibacillus casei]MDZ5496246.1 DUF1788 domain-containing protein [Lacticaseibacillus casei]
MTALDKRFERFREKLKDPAFQQNRGLSNEVGFYIFDYDPKDELRVRNEVENIANTSTPATIKANVQVFNLLNIVMTIFEQMGYSLSEAEKKDGISVVIRQVNNVLKMGHEHNLIVQYIEEHLIRNDSPTIIFLTGVGQVFPLIRSHRVLNTLNQVIDKQPVVMFFPGKYNSLNLNIFEKLSDNNYYRAFRIG